jgi:hypothetical protein
MKDSNCNDIDWYDFSGGTASPKCAIKVSHDSHYKPGLSGYWCPTTDAMWKQIRCGGGWPSGNEGDVCKVWWFEGGVVKSREGVWDPDDGYCLITGGDPPTGGCTGYHTESTDSGVADTCGGRTSGDGKCEQACGATPQCDEKGPGDSCGSNGGCTSDCACCEASDSDGGKNYLVKGTTVGLSEDIATGKLFCNSMTDTCGVGDYVWEYYLSGNRIASEEYYCGQRKDGHIHCIDGRCGCLYDSDCPAQNNIKGKCKPDHTCYWEPCGKDSDCVSGTYCYCGACSSSFTSAGCPDGQCCNKGYGGSGIGECKNKGTIYNSGSVSYICDPPEWNSSERSLKIKNETKGEKNVFELILSFISYFFQR